MSQEGQTDDTLAFTGDFASERNNNLKNHVSPVRSRPSAQSTFIGESENRARTDHPTSPPPTIRLASLAQRLAVSLYEMAADADREGITDVAAELRARAFRLDSWASERSSR